MASAPLLLIVAVTTVLTALYAALVTAETISLCITTPDCVSSVVYVVVYTVVERIVLTVILLSIAAELIEPFELVVQWQSDIEEAEPPFKVALARVDSPTHLAHQLFTLTHESPAWQHVAPV